MTILDKGPFMFLVYHYFSFPSPNSKLAFPESEVPIWGPHNNPYNIPGFILGSPYLGKLPAPQCTKCACFFVILFEVNSTCLLLCSMTIIVAVLVLLC